MAKGQRAHPDRRNSDSGRETPSKPQAENSGISRARRVILLEEERLILGNRQAQEPDNYSALEERRAVLVSEIRQLQREFTVLDMSEYSRLKGRHWPQCHVSS